MKSPKTLNLLAVAAILFLQVSGLQAQKVGFISSDIIRQYFMESKQAEQRIQSIVDEWRRDLDAQQKEIDLLEYEIKKNRLVWSDQEKSEKDKKLEDMKQNRQAFAKTKFEPDGEYDNTVKNVMRPIEQKIFAAVQEVASDEGFDYILDQSANPMPYVNFKYDMTVKVLRKLGVNVDELEKELQQKIDKDPRNQKKESLTPRKKSRTKSSKDEAQDREIERDMQPPLGDPTMTQPQGEKIDTNNTPIKR